MNDVLIHAAWSATCRSLADKLILLALATNADVDGRVRVDPVQLAPLAGMSVARVEGAISSLHRMGLVDARRWEDSGCWSVRLTIRGGTS